MMSEHNISTPNIVMSSEMNSTAMKVEIYRHADDMSQPNNGETMEQFVDTKDHRVTSEIRSKLDAIKKQTVAQGDVLDDMIDKLVAFGHEYDHVIMKKRKENLMEAMQTLPSEYWPVVHHVLQDIRDRPQARIELDHELNERMLKAYDLLAEEIKDGSFRRIIDNAIDQKQSFQHSHQP
jgi:hypothetical protein